MKVLVVGSGGREHTLAWKLRQSPRLTRLYCAPGNAGTLAIAENIPIHAEDVTGLLEFSRKEAIDLTVVGPEAPLVEGIVDIFQAEGLSIFGPSRAAAELEGSKAFAKDFMARHGIPTAKYQVYGEAGLAEEDLKRGQYSLPVVLKADGLAAGKGVLICHSLDEALEGVRTIMKKRSFGAAGARMVIEEFLRGEEASFMAFSDGTRVLPMVASQDHKAIFEGDQGPNTGGMGAYSVDTILTESQRKTILYDIIHPTIQGMASEGRPYRGVLYAGLMLTPDGPRVLEYNVRFGDPEAQAVVPRLNTDLLEVLNGVAHGDLGGKALEWSPDAVVCVVLASGGYPGSYEKGKEISGLEMAGEIGSTVVFHAGTTVSGERVLTSGGRVLGVTARGSSLEAAIMQAYEGVNKISFDRMYYRRDIAAKGLRR